MQIDFHHGVTYVVARLAGFTSAEASIIAGAAQYIDDSCVTGFISFDNGMRFQRTATAHPVFTDPENITNNAENSLSWLPFHFLPGNQGWDSKNRNPPFKELLVCRQDSEIAKAMMAAACETKGMPWGLHRLGIAAHVFFDTFAHKGFVGLNDDLNKVSDIKDGNDQPLESLPIPPVGHGCAMTYPDQPYLVWKYTNANGIEVVRNNPQDFLLAAQRLYQEFLIYRGRAFTQYPDDFVLIEQNIQDFQDKDCNARHQKWLDAIAAGKFSFGPEKVTYIASGEGSWKRLALSEDNLGWLAEEEEKVKAAIADKVEAAKAAIGQGADQEAVFTPVFLTSHYRLFHEAAKWHRVEIFTSILPKFGIVAA